MARLELNIFSFDSRIDFQSGVIHEILHTKSAWHLTDLLENVNAKNFGYQEFGVDIESINVRVNNYAIFENVKVQRLLEKCGNIITLEPLSKKYAKKDLIVDYNLVLQKYEFFFKKFSFIKTSEYEELLKFLPYNFVAKDTDDEYLGDGFMLYVKWLMTIYPLYKSDFLEAISRLENGIFNHINVASFTLPQSDEIDVNIESIQREILRSQKEYEKFSTQISNQYALAL